jgi:hypothetical protein
MIVLSGPCGIAGTKKGEPGNAELKTPRNRLYLPIASVFSSGSAFPGTRHFAANAELGISGIPLPQDSCMKE